MSIGGPLSCLALTARPRSGKPTHLKDHDHEVINLAIPNENFAQAEPTTRCEDQHSDPAAIIR